ncbi:MAG: hypothetical protein IPH12_11875 [Saprospirales bacterium]|nr:hypothetical protein [Saprospirales bacterium]
MFRIFLLATLLPALATAQVADTIVRLDEQTSDRAFLKLPNGALYAVEMSDEADEDSLSFETIARRSALQSCVTATFTGVVRRKAKTSPLPGRAKSYETLDELLDELPSDSSMRFRTPRIDTSPFSERVEEERHNVRIKRAWLFAAFREEDNDFHLIIGNHEQPSQATALMNVEVSGLPEKTASNRRAHQTLLEARTEFIKIFGDTQCRRTFRFPEKGVPVEIKGSLFFDTHHAGTGTGSGNLRPATVWEIHPVTGIQWLSN